jgi:TonB family protein
MLTRNNPKLAIEGTLTNARAAAALQARPVTASKEGGRPAHIRLAGYAIQSLLGLCLSVVLTIISPGGIQSVFAAENRRDDQLAIDSSNALRDRMAELIDAIRKKDGSREKRLLENLIMPSDTFWFAEHFDKTTAEILKSAYAESMRDFEEKASGLYAADVRRGPTEVHINRYADPSTAPPPFDRLLQSMTTRVPLYEVALNGERPSFEIVVPSTGGPSKVVAGDLDGCFVDTAEGFRYIPSRLLIIADQERAKRNFEIFGKDAEGRPTVIRMKNTALTTVKRSYPTYPASARSKHIVGEVTVSARIGKDGRVKEVNVKSGPPELQKAAVNCMKEWRFKPVQIDGYPVEVESDFAFASSLAEN